MVMEPQRQKGESFGSFFKRLRESRGFASQRELAYKSGISNVTISRIENGESMPKVETLKRLAPYLKVSYIDLIKSAGIVPDDYHPPQNSNDDNIMLEDLPLSKEDVKLLEQLIRQIKHRRKQRGWY